MPKTSISFIVVVMTALILLAGYFGTYSQWQKFGEAKTAYDASKIQNEKLKKALADSNAFISKYENNRVLAEKANRTLPVGNPNIPILLDNISKIFQDSGMTVASLSFGSEGEVVEIDPATANSIKTLDITADVSGSYEAFGGLLLRLQQNLRLVDVVSVNVSGGEAGEDEGLAGTKLGFTLKLRTYYQQ